MRRREGVTGFALDEFGNLCWIAEDPGDACQGAGAIADAADHAAQPSICRQPGLSAVGTGSSCVKGSRMNGLVGKLSPLTEQPVKDTESIGTGD